MKRKSLAALLLSFVLLVGALPTAALAADGAYVLMNIPYAEFYRAELGENGAPDAVSAATPMKRSNGGLAKGSYHVGVEGAGVDGVIYPVYDAGNTDPVEIGETVTGGWSHAASPEITDELRTVFDKAFEGFTGSSVTPVAYLGSQVVAGMNHCFLCQSTVVCPGAEPQYVLVYIYESIDGSVSLMNIAELDIGSFCEYGGVDEDSAVGGGAVQIANPFVDYETPDAAAQAAGFALTAPEMVEGYSETSSFRSCRAACSRSSILTATATACSSARRRVTPISAATTTSMARSEPSPWAKTPSRSRATPARSAPRPGHAAATATP